MALPEAEDTGLIIAAAAERLGTDVPALVERLIRISTEEC